MTVPTILQSQQREKIFRTLLVSYSVLLAISVLLVFVETAIVDDLVLNGRWIPSTSMINTPFLGFMALCFSVAYLGALIAAIVGLFKYRNWGRTLFLILTIGGLVLEIAIAGFVVSPTLGLASTLNSAGYLLAGMIIAISYFNSTAPNSEIGATPTFVSPVGQPGNLQGQPAPSPPPPPPVPAPTGETIELRLPDNETESHS